MTNPFDAEDGTYSVLTNGEGQHSLWPDVAEIPAGWTLAYGPTDRVACVDYVNANWTDLRPRSYAEPVAESCPWSGAPG
jgi:MbtH protein